MSEVKSDTPISEDSKFLLTQLKPPRSRSNVEAAAGWRQREEPVNLMVLVVVKYGHEVFEKIVDVLLGVEILPIF